MKRLSLAAVAVAGIVTALPAAAQFAKPEDAVKYRQSAMALQGATLGRVFAMANGRVPFDAKVAAENIEIIAMLNKLQFTAFTDGTEVGNTKAKPIVWTQKDKFAAEVKKNQEAVAKLVAAGKTGSLDEIKAAVGPVGQSCKSCHDEFRKE
jgi:cytochrome c556